MEFESVWPSSKHKNGSSMSSRLTVWTKSWDIFGFSGAILFDDWVSVCRKCLDGGLYAPTSPKVNCGGTTHSESILFWSVQCTKLPNVHEALHVLIGAKMMQIGLREPHAHGTRTGRLECIGIHLYSNSWTCSLHHTWHTYGCSDRSKQKRLHLQLLKFESPHHLNQKPS